MKLNWILGSGVVSIAAVVVACGSSSGSGGAGGAGTGATTTTATGSSTHAATTGKSVAGTAVTSTSTGTAGGACNPVLDTQCNVAGGEACDFDTDPNGTFKCYSSPPNTADLCAACDTKNGPACKDGSTCLYDDASQTTSKCAKYCCNDQDCGGATGSCALGGGTIGFCGMDATGGTTAAATGSSSSGTGGGAFFVPQCTGIPATPPSGGTCGNP